MYPDFRKLQEIEAANRLYYSLKVKSRKWSDLNEDHMKILHRNYSLKVLLEVKRLHELEH